MLAKHRYSVELNVHYDYQDRYIGYGMAALTLVVEIIVFHIGNDRYVAL